MSAPDITEFEELACRIPARCVIGRTLDRLDGQERANLAAALLAEHIGDQTIERWLHRRALRGSDQSVRKHRVGECCCER